MDARLNSSRNATLMMTTGLDTIRRLSDDNEHIANIVDALREIMVGRAIVRAELNGTLSMGLRELTEPLVIHPVTDEGPSAKERESYRLFVKHAEHVS